VYLLVFTHIFVGILVVKGLSARRLYKSFGVKGLTHALSTYRFVSSAGQFNTCCLNALQAILDVSVTSCVPRGFGGFSPPSELPQF
jgi:hypothetical protein